MNEQDIGHILKQILKIVTTLQTKKHRIIEWDAPQLLSAALELSAYRVTASAFIADLDTEASFLEMAAKEAEIEEYKKQRLLTTTQKDSEILAKEVSLELYRAALDKKGQMKKIKEVVDKSGDFVTIIQSTLKRKEQEWSEQRMENK